MGRKSIGAGVLAMAVAGACAAGARQPSPQDATQAAQNQALPSAPSASVPNAPTPQGLPQLNTITPPAPMAPEPLPQNTPDADTADNGGTAPSDKLPSAPAPGQQAGQQETPPEIPAPGQGAAAAYTLKTVHVDFVQIPFTVKDSKGNLVPNLTWRDVRVYENGLRQHMAYWTTDPFPLSVAFVIDQTVTQDTMDKIDASLGALQGAFAPYDEVAVFTYNNGVVEQTQYTAAQSARLGAVLERSKGQGREPLMGWGGPLAQTTIKNNQQVDPNTTPIRGQTSIYQNPQKEFHPLFDAIFTAAQSLTSVDPKRRRVLYVVSDGKEYGSKVKEKELVRYLQTNKISVYATLVGDSSIPGMGFLDRIHLPLTMRDDALPRIASATGGQCDPEFRPRGIENSFADITRTVRTQYTVGYYTHESPLDGRFRHVEIRVMRPNLTVVAPDGYYPTPRNVHQAQPVARTDQTPHPDNQPATPATNSTPPPQP
ncbi:MAG TPA: VWA domain-containing protein [Acidobacteriaceae bacterium]